MCEVELFGRVLPDERFAGAGRHAALPDRQVAGGLPRPAEDHRHRPVAEDDGRVEAVEAVVDDVVAHVGLGETLVDDVDRGVAVAPARDDRRRPTASRRSRARRPARPGWRRTRWPRPPRPSGDDAPDHGGDADTGSPGVERGAHAGGHGGSAAPQRGGWPVRPRAPRGPATRAARHAERARTATMTTDQGDGEPARDRAARPRPGGSGRVRASRARTVPSGPDRRERRRRSPSAAATPTRAASDGRGGRPAGDLAAGGAEGPQAALRLSVAAGLPGHDQPGDRQRREGGHEGEGLQRGHRGADGLADGGVEVGPVLGDVVVADALVGAARTAARSFSRSAASSNCRRIEAVPSRPSASDSE